MSNVDINCSLPPKDGIADRYSSNKHYIHQRRVLARVNYFRLLILRHRSTMSLSVARSLNG